MPLNQRTLLLIGLSVLASSTSCAPPPSPPPPCATGTASPSGTEPETLVRLIADERADFVLDHPLFAEVYDVVFEDDRSIPSALDIVQVEVVSDRQMHTIRIRTAGTDAREDSIIREMSREDQRVTFGVYIDSDGNGVSDYLLTTTDNIDRGVILTPTFELIADMPALVISDADVTMTVPEEIVGVRFGWLAFSGFSPRSEAYHPTPLGEVFFLPQVDVVASVATMTGVTSFYVGGVCQVYDARSTATCPAPPPFTTVPGTSVSGKMFYRKQCGGTEAEFWCVGGAFGARVYGGGTNGWVGKCPYPYGMNSIDAWDSDSDGILDKVFHVVKDAAAPQQPMKHNDTDGDQKIDLMLHEYVYSSNEVESCNHERSETIGTLVAERCCPARQPYLDQSDVPGPGIDGSTSPYNCPLSAP